MGLREKQVAQRKKRILDVADRLIMQNGGVDFSMRTLAAMSEVSPATPYNLFGSKEGILSETLARSLTQTVSQGLASRSEDPLEFVITASGSAVDQLVEEKQLLRPLYLYLLGAIDPVHRPALIKRSVRFWRTVAETGLKGARKQEQVDETEAETVGYMLFSHFLGLLELWVHEDIDDAAFRARAIHGGLQMIAPFADRETAPRLERLLDEAKEAISRLR